MQAAACRAVESSDTVPLIEGFRDSLQVNANAALNSAKKWLMTVRDP